MKELDYFESKEFKETSLVAIKKTFDAELSACVRLDSYPEKLTQIDKNGRVEEFIVDRQGNIKIVSVLEENNQEINNALKEANLL